MQNKYSRYPCVTVYETVFMALERPVIFQLHQHIALAVIHSGIFMWPGRPSQMGGRVEHPQGLYQAEGRGDLS